MLDDAQQTQLAIRISELFKSKGMIVVFVGSTAIVGLGLFERTSKDADALAPPDARWDEAMRLIERIGDEYNLEVAHRGWGTLTLINKDPDGNTIWEVDLIIPEGGLIPPDAAMRIHERAETTPIGATAIKEHVLATKAVAYGDCMGKGLPQEASKYENDLLEFRAIMTDDFDWAEAGLLLTMYNQARRALAADIIHEIFGRHLTTHDEPDPAVA